MTQLESKKLYRGQEAARQLSMSDRFFWKEVARGHIAAVRISSRCVRFRPQDLEAYARRFLVKEGGVSK